MTMTPRLQIKENAMLGFDHRIESDYEEYYHEINPRVWHFDPNLGVSSDRNLPNVSEFHKSEFHNWQLDEYKSSDLLSINFGSDGSEVNYMAFARDVAFGMFTDDDLEQAKLLRVALSTNLGLTRAAGRQIPFDQAFLDETLSDVAVAVFDTNLDLVQISPDAESVLAKAGVLARGGREFLPGKHKDRLGTVAKAVLQDGQVRDVILDGGGQRMRCQMSRLKSKTLQSDLYHIVLRITSHDNLMRAQALQSLSRAERDVVLALCRGKSLRDISSERGVSYNTCRNQLAAAHLKLGTRTLVDVVRDFYPALSV
ncbi:regulatory protein, luxR family [Loktanella sp. DSM 29012]|nr:regulatory protein, luxR family [Loktanella sp. DSM 29012]